MTAATAGPGFGIDDHTSGLVEHSSKPVVLQGVITSSRRWRHGYGEMLIETCEDGSVWIDGKPVPVTLPATGSAAFEQT